MTSGKGIVHSERNPEYLRRSNKMLHGLKIWVASPKELEEIEPSFFHVPENQIPEWKTDIIAFKLIAGEVMGKKSPAPVCSPMYLLELKSTTHQTITIGEHLFGESAIYIVEGSIES